MPESSSWRLLLTAAVTGALFVLAGVFYLPQNELYCCWLFLSCLLLQALIDYDCQLLLDKVSLLLAATGFFYSWYFQKNLTDLFIGLIAGAGTAVLGIWLGLDKLLLCLLTAFVVGGIAGTLFLLTGRKKRRDAIAFGPFLCLGAAVALLWGNGLLSCYWQLFIFD